MVAIPSLLVYILAVSVSCIHGKSTNESKTIKPEGRIIGGQDAMPGEFPHQVLLLQLIPLGDGSFTGTLCGASLITNEWLLTAAHCGTLQPGGKWEITAGKHSGVRIRGGDPGVQNSSVKEIFIHPCYKGKPEDILFNNDIALIKLSKPFTLNDRVKIIQLDEKDRAKPCNETTAVGWGRINPANSDNAAVLKKATLNLPAAGFCNLTVPLIHEQSQQCVKEKDSSVCNGDSGGPLLCNDGGVNYLCGIASFVEDGRCIGGYNVFVRVSYYLTWIKEVMGSGRNSQTSCVPSVPNGTLYEPPESETRLPSCPNFSPPSTMHGRPQRGFYFHVILTSYLFKLFIWNYQ